VRIEYEVKRLDGTVDRVRDEGRIVGDLY